MAHMITNIDKGLVGFTGKLGKTWHERPEYRMIDEALTPDQVRETIVFPVEKIQIQTVTGIILPDQFQCIRTDLMAPLGRSVSEEYTIVDNGELVSLVESIQQAVPEWSIESCGTLQGGGMSFINLLLGQFQVKGDVSPTSLRILLSNGFGGLNAVSTCAHFERVVCNNRLRAAQLQGEVNGTITKYKHTSKVMERMAVQAERLMHLKASADKAVMDLDRLASIPVNQSMIDSFLEKLIKNESADSRHAVSRAENKRSEIKHILETKADLVDLPMTAYKLLNAVTDWTSHRVTRKGDDVGTQFLSSLQGTSDDINQKAMDYLMAIA